MLAVLSAVVMSASQPQVNSSRTDTTYDSISLVNPYAIDCRIDTCIVLPSHVFRQTTVAIVERNGFKSEVKQRIVLDSLLRVRLRIDSSIIDKQSIIIKAKTTEAGLLRSEMVLISKEAKRDRVRYAAYGFGTGILAGIVSTLLLVMAVN